MPNDNAKAQEIHRATEAIRAASDLARPDSGWKKLVLPWINERIKNLHDDIMRGGCESLDLYRADTAFHKMLMDLSTLPERTMESQMRIVQGPLTGKIDEGIIRDHLARAEFDAHGRGDNQE